MTTKALFINKDGVLLLPTFKFNNYSLLFLQMVTCLHIIGCDPMTSYGECFANVASKNLIAY